MKKQRGKTWDDVKWWREVKEAIGEKRDVRIKVGNLGYVKVVNSK